MNRYIAGLVAALSLCATGTVRAEDPAASDPNKAAMDAASLTKAQSEAAKAQTEARSAELDYQRKAIPNSGATGSVELGDNAGTMEAALLANRQLAALTAQVAAQLTPVMAADACGPAVKDDCRQVRKILLLTSEDDVSAVHATMYQLRLETLQAQFDHARRAYRTAKGEPAVITEEYAFTPGTALAAAANLASYFVSSTKIGGVTVAPSNDAMLAALAANVRHACRYHQVYIAAHLTTSATNMAVARDLVGLNAAALELADELADAKAKAESKDKKVKAKWAPIQAELSAALDAYNAFVTTLNDEKGGLPLSAVLHELAVQKLLADPHAYQLFATYVAAGGGYYSQQNLWTVGFGAVPFHVSGGSALSFALVRPDDGAVLDAGTVEGATSYIKVKDVADVVAGAKATAADVCS